MRQGGERQGGGRTGDKKDEYLPTTTASVAPIWELPFPPLIKYGVNFSGNLSRKDWIPDQVRNDKIAKLLLRHYTRFVE